MHSQKASQVFSIRFWRFNTLLANDISVDVAANLTGKMIESMILMSGKQDGGD